MNKKNLILIYNLIKENMCVTQFRDFCDKFRFYHFSSKENYDKGIDYNGIKIQKKKYSKYGIIYNPSGLPTFRQGYGIK